MEFSQAFFRGIGWDPNRGRFQDDSRSKRQRNLKMVPAVQLDLVFHRDVETEDGGSGFERQQNRALFGHISRTSGPVDGERGVAALTDESSHFAECPQAAPRTRSPRRSVAKTLNTLGYSLTIQIHARHHD